MAMTLTAAEAFLKEYYSEGIADTIQQFHPLADKFKREVKQFKNVGGKGLIARFPQKYARNEAGIGWRAAGGTLPSAGNFTGQQPQVAMKSVYGRIQIEGQAIAAGSVADASFGDEIKLSISDMEEGMAEEFARCLHGDGSGYIAVASASTTNATTVTVNTPPYVAWLRQNMVVDVYTAKSGGSQEVDSLTLNAIDQVNNTVTLSAADTVSSGSFFFREDSRGLALVGLQAAVDDGSSVTTYQNINRTTSGNDFNKGILYNVGAALSHLALSQGLIRTVKSQWSGRDPADIAVTDWTTMTWLAKMFSAGDRYDGGAARSYAGGWKTMTWAVGGMPVEFLGDWMAYEGYLYFLKSKNFRCMYAKGADFKWNDRDGRILLRVNNQDSFEGWMYAYCNLACTVPGGNVRVYNYTAPA